MTSLSHNTNPKSMKKCFFFFPSVMWGAMIVFYHHNLSAMWPQQTRCLTGDIEREVTVALWEIATEEKGVLWLCILGLH